jgi:predicted nucleic acid-binding protein
MYSCEHGIYFRPAEQKIPSPVGVEVFIVSRHIQKYGCVHIADIAYGSCAMHMKLRFTTCDYELNTSLRPRLREVASRIYSNTSVR